MSAQTDTAPKDIDVQIMADKLAAAYFEWLRQQAGDED